MDPVGGRRLAAVWAIPAVAALVIIAPPLVLVGRLPDPLAVHWGTDGAPNGSMGFWGSLAFLGGFWLVAWLGLLVAGHHGVPSAPALAVVYFLGGLLGAVQIAIVDRNLNAADWRAAGEIEWWGAVVVVGAAVAAGAGGWYLGAWAGLRRAAIEPGPAPSAGLSAGESGEWVGTAAVRWPIAAAAAVLATIPFVPATLRWVPVIPALLVGLFTSVTVTVDHQGMVVGVGWFGWPRRRIGLGEIERAEVVDVEPIAYGGWGYRVRPGSTAVIVRSGPGIRVIRRARRDFVVTVDEPERGAGVLNDLVGRAGPLVEG